AEIFNGDVNGSFGGVGMEMGMSDKGDIQVIAPLKDSPAQAAGMLSGDIITSIGTTSAAGMTTDAAVKLIRGPIGTTVTLGVLHQGATKPVSITITRQTINIPIIDTKEDGGVFTISLYSFSQNSADLFKDALRKFIQSGDTKLILDLRGNPGGYLDAAVQMASYFLPVGDTIVTEDTKGHGTNVVHRSLGYNVFANKKLSMAILVDQGSASASEILSGALQQHNVAKLIGTRTFGKGSVQQLVDLGGGAELKVTIARWLTPNGTNISDGGLTPDIKVPAAISTTAAQIHTSQDAAYQAATSWLATQ
ncbi:MAG TPA: S41 family peptidase, partial [Candidatus Paceibacterota bacterium]